ncbi:AI-2E family transporter [Oceanobacillus jordanicus]|uniref:AI-2E family transporter n=1 Tax=Oceanobacillus jordanicus TaxID=2867266 RepID=A0AAW5BBF9_9BACI|nr:AI-2E family transporter [Oceanobacillus jordanicus]MCG3420719.1 AI-2E family transporter [Oceanobacillus jordanicus]
MFKDRKGLTILYWLIFGIFLFLFVYLMIKLFPFYGAVFSFLWHLLAPFIIACFIAYLLYPVINRIHSLGIPRGLAILFIYLLFFGGVGYLVYRIFPVMLIQIRDLNEQLPQFVSMYEKLIYRMYEYTSFLPETVHDKIDELIIRLEGFVNGLLSNIIESTTKIFDMIVVITVIPVLVFYFLKDDTKIKSYIKRYIPEKYKPRTGKMVRAVDETIGNYIRGQLIVCLFVSITSFILFQLLGLQYALLLALIMGITNIIPYFGPIIGAIPAVAIALTMSGKMVIFVILSVFVMQLIESNLLAPYIVGKSINMHPIAIIFALLLGGQLFGVLGMILAVPVFTTSKVIIKHLLHTEH